MAWLDGVAEWVLESKELGYASMLFPAGGRAARASWTISDEVWTANALTLAAAEAAAAEINATEQTQKLQQHATVQRANEAGAYKVVKTVHRVQFNGTEYSKK